MLRHLNGVFLGRSSHVERLKLEFEVESVWSELNWDIGGTWGSSGTSFQRGFPMCRDVLYFDMEAKVSLRLVGHH